MGAGLSAQLHHCWRCHRHLPAARFNRNRARANGLSAECRECKHIERSGDPMKAIVAVPVPGWGYRTTTGLR